MCEYRLSFCEVIPVSEEITETIVDENIEVDNKMIEEYHEWLAKHHDGNIGLLINKKNHYSYSFDAQLEIGMIDSIKAIAVIVPDASREIAANSILNMGIRKNISHQVFYNRQKAIHWLEEELAIF